MSVRKGKDMGMLKDEGLYRTLWGRNYGPVTRHYAMNELDMCNVILTLY